MGRTGARSPFPVELDAGSARPGVRPPPAPPASPASRGSAGGRSGFDRAGGILTPRVRAHGARRGSGQVFRRAAIAALVVLAATALALPILPGRPELVLVHLVDTGCLVLGGGACLWAGLRERGAERAWRLLVGAMVLSLGLASGAVVRDIIFNHSGPIPRLTSATLLYLVPAAAGFAGLLCVPSEPYDLALHGRGDGRDRRWLLITALDSLIVVGAVALLLWTLILRRAALSPTASPDLPYFMISPLVAGLLSIVVVLTAAFRRPRSPHSLAMLGAGIIVFSFSSAAHAYAAARGRTDLPRVIDLGFAVGALCIALAALLPPAAIPAGAEERGRPRRHWWHAVLPYLPVLVAGTGALLQSGAGDLGRRAEIWALLALLALALVRQMVTMVDNTRLLTRVEEKQRQLRHQAFHDPLTGLANRALFAERLTRALADRERHPRGLAVLFCDLDDFKDVNDVLGHAAGDELLKITAARLAAQVRPTDTVARFGGDEFAILLESDGNDPAAVGRRLAEAVRAPARLARTTYTIAVSVGLVTVGPDSGPTSAENLLHRADLAMYQAKSAWKRDPAGGRPVSRPTLTTTRCDGPGRLGAPPRASPLDRSPPPGVPGAAAGPVRPGRDRQNTRGIG